MYPYGTSSSQMVLRGVDLLLECIASGVYVPLPGWQRWGEGGPQQSPVGWPGTKRLNHQWKYLWLGKGIVPFLLTAINNTLITYLKHKSMEQTGELSFAALFRDAGIFGYLLSKDNSSLVCPYSYLQISPHCINCR